MMFLGFLLQYFGESFILGRENSHIQVDFKSQVRKFCLGKFDNFCSEVSGDPLGPFWPRPWRPRLRDFVLIFVYVCVCVVVCVNLCGAAA